MKKPNEKAYTIYYRYIEGDRIDDLAYEQNISNSQAYKNIKRVEEYEKILRYPRIEQILKSNTPAYILNGCNCIAQNVKLHILYDTILTLYITQMRRLKWLVIMGGTEIIENIYSETAGYDVIISLDGWEYTDKINKNPKKFRENIIDTKIIFSGENHNILKTIKAFNRIGYQDKILKINLNEELKQKVWEALELNYSPHKIS